MSNVRRVASLVIYTLALVLTTAVYYGWQHFKILLRDHGTFANYCEDAAPCPLQDRYLDSAYTVATSFEFIGAVAAGMAFDSIGPSFTCAIGQVLFIGSWPIILYTSNCYAVLTGFAIQGLSCNLIAFPALTLLNMFPNNKYLIGAVVVSMQKMGSLIMPVLYSIQSRMGYRLDEIILGFIVVALPVIIAYISMLPWRFENQNHLWKQLKCVDDTSANAVMKSISYIGLLLWYVLMILQMNVFMTMISTVGSLDVSAFFGWTVWAQAPVAIAIGMLNDLVSSWSIALILSLLQLVAFGLVIANSAVDLGVYGSWQYSSEMLFYIGSVVFICATSYVYTVKFSYLYEYCNSKHFGRLIGVISLAAGVVQLLNMFAIFSSLSERELLIVYASLVVPEMGCLVLMHRTSPAGQYITLSSDSGCSSSFDKLIVLSSPTGDNSSQYLV